MKLLVLMLASISITTSAMASAEVSIEDIVSAYQSGDEGLESMAIVYVRGSIDALLTADARYQDKGGDPEFCTAQSTREMIPTPDEVLEWLTPFADDPQVKDLSSLTGVIQALKIEYYPCE